MGKLEDLTTEEIEKKIAEHALFAQNACNLSGVVFGFADVMQLICELNHRPGNEGTQFKNSHPVSVLFSSKIASLTNSEDWQTFSKAYDWATARTDEKQKVV